MRILGIESSCDETAVCVFEPPRTVLSDVLHSQVKLHRPYGGVVPELASRAHLARISTLLQEALEAADSSLEDIDAVAVTRGPGLLGALLVGLQVGQGIAFGRGIPFVGVNHLHGHLLSPDLEAPMQFPCLVLLVTGGHTALYRMDGPFDPLLLKRTVDDAVGEAFDKVAKQMNLSYPGGPAVEQAAKAGDPKAFALPRPRPKDPTAYSLSGLKTAVRRTIEREGRLSDTLIADLTASFQAAVADMLSSSIADALTNYPDTETVYLVGGVARNTVVRNQLVGTVEAAGSRFFAPAPRWCTDNGAMIARAGWARLDRGDADPWDLQPKSRWEVGRWSEESGP